MAGIGYQRSLSKAGSDRTSKETVSLYAAFATCLSLRAVVCELSRIRPASCPAALCAYSSFSPFFSSSPRFALGLFHRLRTFVYFALSFWSFIPALNLSRHTIRY